MKSIVVPINFSANSANAAGYAADMALAIEAKLQLINVVQLPVSVAEIPMPDYVIDEMESSRRELLDSLSAALIERTRGQVTITTHMEIGSVEYKLEEYCSRQKPFMVVMGSSANTMETVLTGSDAEKAMKHLPYPLLIVPEGAAFHAIRKIVLACDLNDIGAGLPASLPFLEELSTLFGARFEVINVMTRDEQIQGESLFQFNSWKDRLKEIFPDLQFIRMDNIGQGVTKYLDERHADWLVVFPKQHSFFEFHRSQAKKIGRICPIPLMSIHE